MNKTLRSISHFDEGLGTVYERFILNSFFDDLIGANSIDEVLEVPLYGMTGLTGINSVHFVNRGCNVTLVDPERENVDEALTLWNMLPYKRGQYKVLYHENISELPFVDGSFDLVWNFAALWHVKKAGQLLYEMARVSSNLILIVVPNKKQIGYLLRKHILDKEFFEGVDETWADIGKIVSMLASLDLKVKDQGVMDVPPWPDTCMPIGQMLEKLKIKKNRVRKGPNSQWTWDIMSYYLGKDCTLKKKVERFSFIEKMSIPWQFKALWAHHRYVIFSKK